MSNRVAFEATDGVRDPSSHDVLYPHRSGHGMGISPDAPLRRALLLFCQVTNPLTTHTERSITMATFLIERNIAGASQLTAEQLRDIARVSNEVVDGLGVAYTWQHSYVAGDKIYCVHETDDVEAVREHARRGGFPADVVVEVAAEFGPETANS